MENETAADPGRTETPEEIDRATRAERQRVQEINRLVTRTKAPVEFATRAIDAGTKIEVVREQILNYFADRDVNHMPGADQYSVGSDDRIRVDAYEGPRDNFDRALADGMLLRAGIRVEKPHAAARDTRRMSTIEMMRSYLSHHGTRAGSLSVSELVTRAMTTSDFPLLLTNAAGAALRRGFEDEPASHKAWTRGELVPDFKELPRPILGSAPSLQKVNEHNEFTDGSLDEDSTSYRIDTYGRIVQLTRQVIVNDQLDAFLRLQPAMGAAAARLEADLVYNLLLENAGAGPEMQDGVDLFDATHGNLGTTGGWSLFLLGAARTLLRKQTALGGGRLSLVPRFIIAPAELETDIEVALAAAARHVNTTTGNDATVGLKETPTPNWAASLQLVVEPRLPASAFYLATESSQIDHCVVGRLDENGGQPFFGIKEGFRKDGVSFKIRHDFGVKFLDWRGIIKAPVG